MRPRLAWFGLAFQRRYGERPLPPVALGMNTLRTGLARYARASSWSIWHASSDPRIHLHAEFVLAIISSVLHRISHLDRRCVPTLIVALRVCWNNDSVAISNHRVLRTR